MAKEYKLPYTAAEIDESLGKVNGLVSVDAKVGQTIVVKAVDESGKPTEWEAADMTSGEWTLLGEITSDGAGVPTGITIEFDGSKYKEVFVIAYNCPADTLLRIVLRSQLAWYNAVFFGYNGTGTSAAAGGKMNNPWAMTGHAYDIGGLLFAYGGAEAVSNGGKALWRQGLQSGTIPTTSLASMKYISVDTNSGSGIVPEGVILKAWGR